LAISSINIYCDESGHLENDGSSVMVLGSVRCDVRSVRRVSFAIRALKASHGLSRDFEVKWTKISPAKAEFYTDLVKLFLDDDALRFRGVLVPDKALLDHGAFDQTHDDWYYKMYYVMLHPVLDTGHAYRIYLDIKDTRGGTKTRCLHDVLCSKLRDDDRQCVRRVQQVRSHESEILQLADLLIGAIAYENRELSGNDGKRRVVLALRDAFGAEALTVSSSRAETKFNLLAWRPAGENP